MKVLALDLDGTTIGAKHITLPHYLTPAIVNFAKENNFDCVVFVTKRSATNFAKDLWQYVVSCPVTFNETKDTLNIGHKDSRFNVHRPYFLSHILGNAAQNFHTATDIPLLTISTEDDVSFNECGRGYMSLIRGLEKKLLDDLEKGHATLEVPAKTRPLKTQHGKNTQLQLLVRKVNQFWPGEVDLTFIDDIYEHCVAAQTAFTGDPNVKLTSLFFENSETLIPIEEFIKKKAALRSKLFSSAKFFQTIFEQQTTHLTYSVKLTGNKGRQFETSIQTYNVEDLHQHFGGIEALVNWIGEGEGLSFLSISLDGAKEGISVKEQFDTAEDFINFLNDFLPDNNDMKPVYVSNSKSH